MIERPLPTRVPSARAEKAKVDLHRRLGPSKVLDGDALDAYASDESDQRPVLPDVAVLASSAEDIRIALEVADAHDVPLTPRAAGSGKSGGAVPVAGGIVLSTLGMDRILELDPAEQICVVEPGVVLGDLHRAVEAEGLFYPPDANSLSWCALGGNLAENAGGPRAFKYGVTRTYTLGLSASLMGGKSIEVGRRTPKGVTGYDLTALFVGSEGTLGVIDRATLRLIPKPEHVVTLLALFLDVSAAGRAVAEVLRHRVTPRCLELMDPGTVSAVRNRGVSIDEKAEALLLIEVDGSEAQTELDMERVGNACVAAGAIDVLVAQDASRRDQLWEARRTLSEATRAMARFKISEDVVVPRQSIVTLLEACARISEETGIRMVTYGHAGDGNLHVNFLWDDPDAHPTVKRGMDALFREVVRLRGTLTGEHGVGSCKAEYLGYEQSDRVIALQRSIKGVFDPKGLLNPGKIFPRPGHGAC